MGRRSFLGASVGPVGVGEGILLAALLANFVFGTATRGCKGFGPVRSIGRMASLALSDLRATGATHPISNSSEGKGGPILFLIKGSAVHAKAGKGKSGKR